MRYVRMRPVSHSTILTVVIMAVTCSIAAQYSIKFLVDTLATGDTSSPNVWQAFAILASLIAADNLLWRAAGWISGRTFVAVTGDVRRDLFRHLTKHAPSFFADRLPGTLTSRISATANAIFTMEKMFVFNVLPPCAATAGAIGFVFTINTPMALGLVIIAAVLAGIALPLSPVQILWINLVTALTLSLTLAREPAEPGIMRRMPRSATEQVLSSRAIAVVLTASVVIGVATFVVYLLERDRTGDYAVAQTSAVLMLALGQLAFLLNCRLLNGSAFTVRVLTGNRNLWISAGLLMALQIMFTYAPFMNDWFDSTPIGFHSWALTAGLAVGVFVVMEGAKAVIRRIGNRTPREQGALPAGNATHRA